MVVSHFQSLSTIWVCGEKNKLKPDKLVICGITSVGDLMKFFN